MNQSIFLLFIVLFTSCSINTPITPTSNTNEHLLTWNGVERSYYTYVPKSLGSDNDVPILFVLHGGGGLAEKTSAFMYGRFDRLADQHGFIVVYPQGIEKQWNDGRGLLSVRTMRENTDDVGYITAIIAQLKKEHTIDESRIFTSGISNGGFMSTRLACDRPDIFKGAAIVTASISEAYLPKCNPSQAISILIMNGTADELVPYDGGQVRVLGRNRGLVLSTDDYFDFWKEKNNCTGKISTWDLPDTVDDGTTVSVRSYEDCGNNSAVQLYSINGGGHTWPGGLPYLNERVVGKVSKEINACDVIWEFFSQL